jgi:hypothetical protein
MRRLRPCFPLRFTHENAPQPRNARSRRERGVLPHVTPCRAGEALSGLRVICYGSAGLALALDLDSHTDVREGAHYGVVVEKPEEVDAAIARLRDAGYAVDVETEETCCYAVQNKVWATDPDGRRWETYYVLEETAERDDEATRCCTTDDALAAPSSSCRSSSDEKEPIASAASR